MYKQCNDSIYPDLLLLTLIFLQYPYGSNTNLDDGTVTVRNRLKPGDRLSGQIVMA
jgi:hypothetical protein